MVVALMVPADDAEAIALIDMGPTHQDACARLNVLNVDTVFLGGDAGGVLLDAHGKNTGKPVNPRATRLTEVFLPGFARRDIINGDALFVGFATDPNAYPNVYADAANAVTTLALSQFGTLALAQ